MSEHTSGPWKVGDLINGYREIDAESWEQLALVVEQVGRRLDNEGVANACLIAAAPDLLEALEMVKKWDSSTYSESGAFSIPHEIRALIQSALAKAKGEV